jgi:hypothetical protein
MAGLVLVCVGLWLTFEQALSRQSHAKEPMPMNWACNDSRSTNISLTCSGQASYQAVPLSAVEIEVGGIALLIASAVFSPALWPQRDTAAPDWRPDAEHRLA